MKVAGLMAGALTIAVVTAALVGAQGNPDAAKLKNPAEANAESLAAGEKTYQKFCRGCHARDGGGSIGPSLIDETWVYGSTDGEIFTAIQKGTSPRMEAWEERIDVPGTWHLVNYIRSLAPKAQ
jgi:cytochrome c oxidase cbb3-type subunit 3